MNSGWKGLDFCRKGHKAPDTALALSLTHCVCALISLPGACMPGPGPLTCFPSLNHSTVIPASFAAAASPAALSLGFLCSFAIPFF